MLLASSTPLGCLWCRRSMGASARPPGGRRLRAPIPFAPRKARPGSAACGFRRTAAQPTRLPASCRTLGFAGREHESSVVELGQLLDATPHRLDGLRDAPRIAAGVAPDVLQEGE